MKKVACLFLKFDTPKGYIQAVVNTKEDYDNLIGEGWVPSVNDFKPISKEAKLEPAKKKVKSTKG